MFGGVRLAAVEAAHRRNVRPRSEGGPGTPLRRHLATLVPCARTWAGRAGTLGAAGERRDEHDVRGALPPEGTFDDPWRDTFDPMRKVAHEVGPIASGVTSEMSMAASPSCATRSATLRW